MAEMNAAFFEEAKYNLQHGKINFLNVPGSSRKSLRSAMWSCVCLPTACTLTT